MASFRAQLLRGIVHDVRCHPEGGCERAYALTNVALSAMWLVIVLRLQKRAGLPIPSTNG